MDSDTPWPSWSARREGAGRPRDEATRKAILRAALALVRESGYRSLTIEKIALRAGAGKTTIYRWWPSKAAVVMDAFLNYISPVIRFAPISAVSASTNIRRQMQAVARAYAGPHGHLLRALIAEAQFDPELCRAFVANWILPRRKMATAILKAGIQAGEFRKHVDVDAAIDALYGGLYYRFLIPHAPLSPKFARELADAVLAGLLRAHSTR